MQKNLEGSCHEESEDVHVFLVPDSQDGQIDREADGRTDGLRQKSRDVKLLSSAQLINGTTLETSENCIYNHF